MAMVNPALLNLATAAQVKDSRWLTLEVCREFQRNKCTRTDTECKFAHPPPHVEVQNGRVTACFDSIKGKCQRKEPPCKYLHPPQHLREQLLQNGRNNLILKNLHLQAAQQAAMNHATGMMPAGIIPIMFEAGIGKTAMALPGSVLQTGQYPPMLGHPYLSNTCNSTIYNPYITTGMPTIAVAGQNGESPSLTQHHGGVIPTAMQNAAQATKLARPDRLETANGTWSHPHLFQSQNPMMMGQYKRIAVADAKGLPTMYQPISNIAYQQTLASMQSLQQPQFIPVSFAGHPPSVQRF